jgi:signal peptidase I
MSDEAGATVVDGPADDPDGGQSSDPEELPARKERGPHHALIEWLVVIAVAVGFALLLKSFVVEQFQVDGHSMDSTLHNGDRVLVNKLSYRLHDPRRGDVVVLKRLDGPNGERDLIKRVIALPGEAIEVRDCQVLIDDRVLDEPYLDPQVVTPNNCGKDQPELVIPEGEVFVMGDNRGGSMDSRDIGPIPESDLIGRAFVIIWPAGDWAWL